MSVLDDLESILQERARTRPEGSYTSELLGDPERVQRKIMEEAFEVCLELGRDSVTDTGRIAEEAADLLYHLLVGLVGAGVSLAEVERVLEERRR
ncbi:MAG TPA: phosphoribosyl-ATP diphosphatase [Acidimicrobiales bacterium]|nr:phosphoribosyl-ATP diphosphatase [Acidimicrobiales bacterium]